MALGGVRADQERWIPDRGAVLDPDVLVRTGRSDGCHGRYFLLRQVTRVQVVLVLSLQVVPDSFQFLRSAAA